MRHKTNKRVKEDKIYEQVKARLFSFIPYCCSCRKKPAVFIHHVYGRQGRKFDGLPLLVDPWGFVPICAESTCHPARGAENDPRDERERGECECYHNRLREILLNLEPLAGAMRYRDESIAEAVKKEAHQ